MIVLSFIASNLSAQTHVPGIAGKSFIAVTVSNVDSTSMWYENVFGVKLLKEIKTPNGLVHIKIEGNEFLMIEILQINGSKRLNDCDLNVDEAHLLQGFFKMGLFVKDANKAEQYFKSKGLAITNPLFHDKETATTSFIVQDPGGNMLQFIEDKSGKK